MRSPVVTALVGMVALAIPMGVGRFAFTLTPAFHARWTAVVLCASAWALTRGAR